MNSIEDSGIFGKWINDEDGLPAYEYEMRHYDPAASWDPVIKPKSSLHWHQLGNNRITANAYNLGMVKVFCGETGQLWLNEYDPAAAAHCGGFGWLISDNSVLIDRDDCIPEGAVWERIFGTGYFLKRIRLDGIVYERRTFAPAGDEPCLISEVRIMNDTGRPRDFHLMEYWDVNISRITRFVLNRFMNTKIRHHIRLIQGRDGSILSALPLNMKADRPQRPCYIDPDLPGVFLASLDEMPDVWITDPGKLFKGSMPDKYPDLSGSVRPNHEFDRAAYPQKNACLAAVMRFNIMPGSEKIFRFVYGYAKGRKPEEITASVIRKGLHLWGNTASFWKQYMPAFKTTEDEGRLGRELAWNNYYFNSSSQYDAYYRKHYIPQAGNYLYDSGFNGASRDFFENILTLIYYDPEKAREMLEFTMKAQKPDGAFFYSIDGFGKRNRLFYRPSDLDLWFLWALCEYIFTTRDFAFLEAPIAYYPLHRYRIGNVWEHAKKAFYHLMRKVGTGRHGHIRIRLSDWNDEMTWLASGGRPADILMTVLRGESVLNTAMACYILPMFEQTARLAGEPRFAEIINKFRLGLVKALESAWHKDHLIRAYSGNGKPFGTGDTWLEPMVWALMAQEGLRGDKKAIAVDTIRQKLLTRSGVRISDSGADSMTTRKGEQESGGIWFAINAPAAIALSLYDRDLAWDVFKRNTLTWHAKLYPGIWYGIWSGPDAFNAEESGRPGETWYQINPAFSLGAQAYPVQNIHAHGQMMYALAKLAGLSSNEAGWRISPGIPHDAFSFSCSLYGIDISPGKISGYACLPVSTQLKLNIELPGHISGENIMVDGQPHPALKSGDMLEIQLSARKGERITWEIS